MILTALDVQVDLLVAEAEGRATLAGGLQRHVPGCALLARIRCAYAKRDARPEHQRVLTKDPLKLLLATCDASLLVKRDRTLLLFGWHHRRAPPPQPGYRATR